MANSRPVQLDLFRSRIPMRRFDHAARSRAVAEAVLVRLTLSDGRCGWGEALPRAYVTGETLEGVVADLSERYWPAVLAGDGSAAERVGAVGEVSAAGRNTNSARCAMELALLDALGRGAGGWPALAAELGLARPARRIAARVSAVLGSADPSRTARQLWLMRWFGLRDVKLKLGLGEAVDAENLRIVTGRIGRSLGRGRMSLRVDVNGGWRADETPDRVAELAGAGVEAVEQPTRCPAGELAELARRCRLPLIADESLLTREDSETLLAGGGAVAWNVRICKNGGLVAATELARRGRQGGVTVICGCMVGETGILSAAQRRLLQHVPTPRAVEGNYGRFLLSDDVTRPSPRMGWGGRLATLRGPGLGVAVERRKVDGLARPVATLTA
jgi:muconate cycloisomerase